MSSREFLEYVKNDLKGIKADLKGFLDVNKTQGATALDYQRKSADQMDKLLSLIDGNKPSPNREPITIDQDG